MTATTNAYRVPRARLALHVGDIRDDLRATLEELRRPDADVGAAAADITVLLGRLSAIAGLLCEPAADDA